MIYAKRLSDYAAELAAKETNPKRKACLLYTSYKLFDTFLSVRLTAGTHIVELRYMPQGLKAGGMITAGLSLIHI